MNFIILTLLVILAFPLYGWLTSHTLTESKPPLQKVKKQSWFSQQPNSLKFMLAVTPLVMIVCIKGAVDTKSWVLGLLGFFACIGVAGIGALFLDEN